MQLSLKQSEFEEIYKGLWFQMTNPQQKNYCSSAWPHDKLSKANPILKKPKRRAIGLCRADSNKRNNQRLIEAHELCLKLPMYISTKSS